MKLGERVAWIILLSGINWLTASSALAQTKGGAVTIHFTTFSPFIALLAGILILIVPRLLNYIVAVYLILVGLIGSRSLALEVKADDLRTFFLQQVYVISV